MANASIIGNFKGFSDFQQEAQKQGLAQALMQAQIGKLNTPEEFNIDKVGQQAFIKASQGVQLSPTEAASLQYLDNKTQTATFNPVTGLAEQRPSLLQRAGISAPSVSQDQAIKPSVGLNFAAAMKVPTQGGGDFLSEIAPQNGSPANVGLGVNSGLQNGNQWDAEYEKQLALVGNNPKARQDLMTAYAKKKFDMNDQESKDATFADRMSAANPLIEKYTPAALNNSNVRLGRNLPDFIANRVVSDDYQSFNQAQRDFINAQLRKESGAAIAPSEFNNAAQQYFPQVGDSQQVLTQKKLNREAAVAGMSRAAGPAYKPAALPVSPVKNEQKSNYADKEKAARDVASPDQLAAFKKKYGIK